MSKPIINQPTRITGPSFNDWLQDISSGWEQKAKDLQKRRWPRVRDEDIE